PQEVIDQITTTYRRQLSLDIGFYLRIEPLLIVSYAPGGELVVTDVRLDRDRVRLSFGSVASDVPAGELATALTVQWPTNLRAARAHSAPLNRGFHWQIGRRKGCAVGSASARTTPRREGLARLTTR